jgi:integrase
MRKRDKIVWFRGKWAHLYYTADGTRKRDSLGTTNREEAREILAEKERIEKLASMPVDPTIGQLWNRYRTDMAHLRSMETSEHLWKALAPTFASLRIDEITRPICRSYAKRRLAAGMSQSTASTELGRLRMIVSHAKKERLIADAPYIEVPAPGKPRDYYLTKADAKKFIQACVSPHVRLFCILAIATGARKEALLSLRWHQVDFIRNQVDLRGDSPGSRYKGRAIVPMNKELRSALHEAHAGALTPFVIEYGGAPIKDIKKAIQNTGKRCKMPKVTAHVFRHSCAVWMAEDRIPMAEIAQYLGHSNTRVTENTYARFSPDHLVGASEATIIGL